MAIVGCFLMLMCFFLYAQAFEGAWEGFCNGCIYGAVRSDFLFYEERIKINSI